MHSQFLCSFASFKLSTLGVRQSSRVPTLIDGYSTRHSGGLIFCSCDCCLGVVCVLLRCPNEKLW